MLNQKKAISHPFAILKNSRALACSALFIALSIICGKYLAIPVGNILRFSFENLPIILSGIIFGPVLGGLVGLFADILGCVLVGYAINPVVTAGAVSIGAISGIAQLLCKNRGLSIRLAVSVSLPHIFGSVVIKTFGLAVWYDIPTAELMLWRLLNYAIVGVLEYIILYTILKNKSVSTSINSMLEG